MIKWILERYNKSNPRFWINLGNDLHQISNLVSGGLFGWSQHEIAGCVLFFGALSKICSIIAESKYDQENKTKCN